MRLIVVLFDEDRGNWTARHGRDGAALAYFFARPCSAMQVRRAVAAQSPGYGVTDATCVTIEFDPLVCEECGHRRLNRDQASACCTMQGSPCPGCASHAPEHRTTAAPASPTEAGEAVAQARATTAAVERMFQGLVRC